MTSVNSNELILTFDYGPRRRTRVLMILSLTRMPYLTPSGEFDLNDRRTQVHTCLTMTADSVTNILRTRWTA